MPDQPSDPHRARRRSAPPHPASASGGALRVALAALLLTPALGLVTGACGEKHDPVQEQDAAGLTPTWCEDVQPIVASRCLGCHSVSRTGSQRNGAPVGVNFDTYEDASRLASAMDDLIQAGVMPPSGALPAADQATFGAWVDTGRPEGVCQ